MKPQVSHLLTAAPSISGPGGHRMGNQACSQTRTTGSNVCSGRMSEKPEDSSFLEEMTFELFFKWTRGRTSLGRREAERRGSS